MTTRVATRMSTLATNDYNWLKAIQDALHAGDMDRVRSLGVLADHLLDLSDDMPAALWNAMYAKVSQGHGIEMKSPDAHPTLTLIKGGATK